MHKAQGEAVDAGISSIFMTRPTSMLYLWMTSSMASPRRIRSFWLAILLTSPHISAAIGAVFKMWQSVYRFRTAITANGPEGRFSCFNRPPSPHPLWLCGGQLLHVLAPLTILISFAIHYLVLDFVKHVKDGLSVYAIVARDIRVLIKFPCHSAHLSPSHSSCDLPL